MNDERLWKVLDQASYAPICSCFNGATALFWPCILGLRLGLDPVWEGVIGKLMSPIKDKKVPSR